ncbi:DUF2219 family protein [Xinfangfangia sp. CPCC 101601]|uniref:DUF2219 family protein n=1 Tax=Pseudogemmobacter lacusdianii TaxID=3069608 RepID=A0ABU0W2V3_9RHOB|nr:lipid A-modifier LpxR family protein [Xinfangfangia sp. CPCC 101601]MDQ2067410.1 DUF2219 family protein [Xinfangfangia sp. CPCC 101601]
MRQAFLASVVALTTWTLALGSGAPAQAQERVSLGWGRLFSNDALGDGADRWRSASYTVSHLRGPLWSGSRPDFGEILEYRLRSEFISPENLTLGAAGDRRYAGVLTLGLHTHFEMAGLETSLGVDVAITGPQSGMSRLHDGLHDLLDMPRPMVAADQIPDDAHPTLVAEIGRDIAFGAATLRPFAEAQAGLESFVRIGFDLAIGSYGRGALMLREQSTGQRYRAIKGNPDPGLTLTLGGDVAHVFDSALLPKGGAAVLRDRRERLRAGLAWQGEHRAIFLGLTWLGKEFVGQRESQVVGSLSLNLTF